MGGAIAQHLARGGAAVTYVTPAGHASAWTIMTNEQPQVHRALAKAGIALHTLSLIRAFESPEIVIANLFSGAEQRLACRSLVVVGARLPHDDLYHALLARQSDWAAAGIQSVDRIGDALAPGAIAHAVYSGHRYAREFDQDPNAPLYKRDAPIVTAEPRIYATGAAKSDDGCPLNEDLALSKALR